MAACNINHGHPNIPRVINIYSWYVRASRYPAKVVCYAGKRCTLNVVETTKLPVKVAIISYFIGVKYE